MLVMQWKICHVSVFLADALCRFMPLGQGMKCCISYMCYYL
uniref:Uncharacterized protein n=1 Tax=Aegilops tauschii subsp. strangulata TaxID=200361 RepID=A0A453FVW4_AEGTS